MLIIVIVTVVLLGAPSIPTKASPIVTISLLNLPPTGTPLKLAVGESSTFYFEIQSDEPFVVAMAMTDAYYPGRGVFANDSDRATQGTTASLELTITGKNSTADLPAVCGWPEPGYCWPEGVAPLSMTVGVRFTGGVVYAEIFPFAVVVP